MTLLIWILSQPLFWAVVGILVGPYMFYRGFRLLQLKRRISNVPRSTIVPQPWGRLKSVAQQWDPILWFRRSANAIVFITG